MGINKNSILSGAIVDQSIPHPREAAAPAVGAVAPDFTLSDELGKLHSLSEELHAGKPVVLFFMRGEW